MFTVGILSLNSANAVAPLADFNASQPYTFLLVAAGAITGYRADEFAVDASGFGNNLQGGSFSVVEQGNNLYLQFSPVPEPGSWVMAAGGGLGLLLLAGRRRRGGHRGSGGR